MRELGLAGLVAILFGLGSYYATSNFGIFSIVNLALGAVGLLAALVAAARRLRSVGGPHSRPVILRGLALVAVAAVAAVALERGATWLDLRWDLTFEQRYDPSEALTDRLGNLESPVTALLFHDPLDPRIRRTRLLLDTLARVSDGDFDFELREFESHPEDADRFAVASSNTVVLTTGAAWERVDRPNEATLFEGLYRLTSRGTGNIVLLRGEGEGDPQRSDTVGFAGLSEALVTEGYNLKSVVSAAMREVPPGTDAVLSIAPRRMLLPHTLDALRRYLAGGGRLVAFLEPGLASGVEQILAEYGISSPDALVIDPASGPVEEGRVAGIDILAFNYEVTPVTRGLDRNRMTFFPGTRAFELRKPRIEDELRRLVLSSHRAFTTRDLSWLERRSGEPEPGDAERGYQTLVAGGRFVRDGIETRIVAFGDSGFASNHYLRALYNLDLALNAFHWATENEPAITLRPKIRKAVQFPLPLNSSVQALYSVGLLLPELLLIAAGIVWLRRRSA